MLERFYPIGTPGQPWREEDVAQWFSRQRVRRSYSDEVLQKLRDLDASFTLEQYGALSLDPERYPLMGIRSTHPAPERPWALVTGGVHGYETSGVQGALAFVKTLGPRYAERFNLLVAPCVSPWGYEVVHRWNPKAIDPNRSFVENSPSEECAALMGWLARLGVEVTMHLDLHETTDTDETEFRPALAARDGKPFVAGTIPDGFYVVGDEENPELDFQAAIIAGVETVTHIAPPDEKGQIIGSDVVQRGVIQYPFTALGLCAGVTRARYTSTTEVYPDSPKATPEICNAAQVAAVRSALDHVLRQA